MLVGALYFGRDVFVPLVLAGLLSFALAPLIAWLRRRGIPKIPAVITVVILAFLGISAFGFVVAGQVSELGSSLPRYQYNIRGEDQIPPVDAHPGAAWSSARRMCFATSGPTSRQQVHLRGEERINASSPQPKAPSQTLSRFRSPQPDAAPLQVLQAIVGPLIAPLATAGIVIVFVVFMLLQREDLRDRFIRLVGTRRSAPHYAGARATRASGSAATC